MEPYELGLLPFGTPSDDLHWAAYLDLFAIVFLEDHTFDNGPAAFHRHRYADNAALGIVTTERPGLKGRQVVVGLTWVPIRMNAGGNIVPVMTINTVAVRHTRRHRDLMRLMMDHYLQCAGIAGSMLAASGASEATIYSHLGFGVATRHVDWGIDTRRFAARPGVAVAPGLLGLVNPPLDENISGHLSTVHRVVYRGALSPLSMHLTKADGTWDFDEQGPSRKLWYLFYFDASGIPDRLAEFKHGGFKNKQGDSPAPIAILSVRSPSSEIDYALWQGLAGFDLVEELTCGSAIPDDSPPDSLVDLWAIKQNGIHDGI